MSYDQSPAHVDMDQPIVRSIPEDVAAALTVCEMVADRAEIRRVLEEQLNILGSVRESRARRDAEFLRAEAVRAQSDKNLVGLS